MRLRSSVPSFRFERYPEGMEAAAAVVVDISRSPFLSVLLRIRAIDVPQLFRCTLQGYPNLVVAVRESTMSRKCDAMRFIPASPAGSANVAAPCRRDPWQE